ncbi:MAG: hypothetical protein ACRDTE_22095 [Pseudonocardiaceae bacterium]
MAVPQWVREHMLSTPELSLLVTITASIASLIASFVLVRKQRQWNQRDTKIDRQSARGRPVVLRRVHDRWITVLDRALCDGPRIELGLIRRRDLVRQSVVLVPAEAQEPEPLLPEERVYTVFGQIGGILLLLGAPGSGKTIALLELARKLLSVAESDERHPIPVVFNLASWSSRCPPLSEWLIAELGVQYEIPSAIAQRWVDSGEILPLLDGLDEVETHRESCVEAINSFHAGTLGRLVVACRTEKYGALSTHLLVDEAIELQPPTRHQASSYLKAAGVITTDIQDAIRTDPSLWDLLQSPLVLNIVALAYRGEEISALRISGTHQQRMTKLFGAYVARMLAHRNGRHIQHRMLHWLIWIARSMRYRHESEFHLDRLQPDWLATATQRRLATFGPAVIAGTIVGSADGLIYGLLRGPVDGVINGIAWGLFFGLFVGIRIPDSASKRRRFWLRIRRGGLGGLFLGLVFWLISSPVDALVAGFVFTMAFGLLAELRKTEPVEDVRRSWPKTWLGVVRGIVGGSIIGLLYGQSYGIVDGATNSLIFASSFAAACGLIAGLVTGLVPGLVEKRATPNEGIHRSLRRALALGLPVGLLSGLVFALVFERTSGMMDGIGQGLRDGLIVGLAIALFYGGLACLQHISVRSLLVCHQHAPVGYVRFLDEATDRLIMRRTGSGYIFIHRLLLEYLADLDIPEKPLRRQGL